MTKTYQIKTHALQGGQQVTEVMPAAGKAPVKVPATAGARYELLDPTTQAAPDNIRVMRKNGHLQIFFDGDAEPGAVIENFYPTHTDERPTLVGATEQGKLYGYIPESAAPSAVVTQLGDTGNAYGMALGGAELASDNSAAAGLLAAPLAAGLPLWALGAGVLGAAALAGGGGGGGSAAPVASAKIATGSDTGSQGDNKTSVTTPTLTGTAPTGSSTKVTVNGKDYAAQTLADGTLSYAVTDPLPDGTYTPVIQVTQNGKTTSYNGTPFTIDTATSVKITDSGAAGTTQAIGGTAEAGDIVSVTDANRKLLGSTTADSSGQWRLTPASAVAAGTITASATDVAGNQKTATGAPATDTASNFINGGQALGLSIDQDANNDGFINAAEKGSASTTSVSVSFDKNKVSVGDIVTLTDGSQTQTLTLTAADLVAGKASTHWPLPAEGQALHISATLTDANKTAGNTTPSASDTATLDTLAQNTDIALALSILTDLNHDHAVNIAELHSASSLTSQASFKNAVVGDKIVFTATNDGVALPSQTVTLSAQDIANGHVQVAFTTPADGKVQTVSANHVDMAGNTSADTAPSDHAKLDITAPKNAGAGGVGLTLQITPDANHDGWVNSGELKGAGRLTSHIGFTQAVAGDSVMVNASNGDTTALPGINHVLTSDDILHGGFDVSFINPAEGQRQTVTASYTDQAGNPASDTPVSASAQLDTLMPSTLALNIDLDNGAGNFPYSNDQYINAAEKGTATTTSLTVVFDNSKVAVGDVVTFSDGITSKEVALDQTMVSAGQATSSGWALPAEGILLNVTAILKDAAGNATPLARNSVQLDTHLVNFGPTDTNFTGTQLNAISFTPPGEAGTYKLHIDDSTKTVIEGTLDGNGRQTNTNWLAPGTDLSIHSSAIYLEFWDTAGNYSGQVHLPINTALHFTDKTTFIV